MEVAWRLAVNFLLRGADIAQTQLGYDNDSGFVIVTRRDTLPTEHIKIWGRLMNLPNVERSNRRLRKAIDNCDIITIRQLTGPLIHLVFDRIHISVQTDLSTAALNIWWRSAIHRPKERGASYRSYQGNSQPGTVMKIWLHESFRPFITTISALFPTLLVEKQTQMPLDTMSDQTPNRLGRISTVNSPSVMATPLAGTPALYDMDDSAEFCELCCMSFPKQLTVSSSCGHVSCLSCLGLSVQKRATNPYATPSNMLCPHAYCSSFLTRDEVRQLVSPEAFIALEWNELKNLLQAGAVQCPGCGYLFERIISEDLQNDPLRDKLTCVACHDTFCAMCYTSPYHDGRPCRHGGDDGSAAPKCRYCDNPAQSSDPPVCDAPLCRSRGQQACVVPKGCGHHCYGSCGEQTCVSCLEEGCPAKHPQQSADDYCVICFTDALADSPCLQLECGHVFHKACVEKKIEQRWPCARINFKFLQCPLCEKEMAHHLLAKSMAPVNKLRETLEKRYEDRLKIEGMDECDALTNPQSSYYKKPLQYAADQFNYYQCSKCKRPYFGGLRRCQDVERDEPDKSDLICGGCCAGSAQCDRHGHHYLEWKCKYCCNTAVWFCWGTTHFCELCHSPPRKTVREECEGEERCPLGAKHPPNGTEFALGCAMCRSKGTSAQPSPH